MEPSPNVLLSPRFPACHLPERSAILDKLAAVSDSGPRGERMMKGQFTLEFWRDGDWYVGRLMEVPGVFSQGETLEELQENIQDAYDLMITQNRLPAPSAAQRQPVELEV